METLNVEQVVEVLMAMSHDMEAAKDRLTELDAAIGDGDLGITFTRGFKAVRDGLKTPGPDAGKVLFKAGMDFSNGAGSTMGALLGTAFMRAGKEAQGRTELTLADLARAVKAGENGIREKGKAEPGNKTMLDAIVPAREALEAAAEQGVSLAEGLARATAAAEQGMLATIPMKSSFGRARWLGDRTIGHQDPGATAVHMMLKSVVDSVTRIAGVKA